MVLERGTSYGKENDFSCFIIDIGAQLRYKKEKAVVVRGTLNVEGTPQDQDWRHCWPVA